MDKKLCSLVGRLPTSALLEAARAHLQELSQRGDLDAAKDLFAELSRNDENGIIAAKAGRFLAGRMIFAGKIDSALTLYRNFPEGEGEILLEKLMACDLIVRAMADERTLEAWEIWRPLGQTLAHDGLKWHWALTGLALMETCYRNDLFRLGKEIYSSLLERASCPATKDCLDKAALVRDKMERR